MQMMWCVFTGKWGALVTEITGLTGTEEEMRVYLAAMVVSFAI